MCVFLRERPGAPPFLQAPPARRRAMNGGRVHLEALIRFLSAAAGGARLSCSPGRFTPGLFPVKRNTLGLGPRKIPLDRAQSQEDAGGGPGMGAALLGPLGHENPRLGLPTFFHAPGFSWPNLSIFFFPIGPAV